MSEREARFRAVFDACYGPLQAFARRRLQPAEVDDLVADVLMVAWRRLDDIPDGSALPWLYGVAHRTLANQRRSSGRRLRLVQKLTDQRRSGADRLASSGNDGLEGGVLDALARLRPDDQEILRLASWEELTAGEIAVVLGCSPNAAALRLSRARAKLRAALTATGSVRTHPQREVTDG